MYAVFCSIMLQRNIFLWFTDFFFSFFFVASVTLAYPSYLPFAFHLRSVSMDILLGLLCPLAMPIVVSKRILDASVPADSSQQPDDSSAREDAPATPPPYIVGRRLGRGAFGDVYLLTRTRDNQQFAGKRPRVGASMLMGLQEVQTLQAVASGECPNVIQYHSLEWINGEMYIVMEYAPNGSLHAWIKKRKQQNMPFSKRRVAKMFKQLLTGLAYCHARGVMHRDLKPDNILLGTDRVCKLCDLGLGKQCDLSSSVCHTLCGCVSYVAPEILLKMQYSQKADIWSLGMIFYNILTLEFKDNKELFRHTPTIDRPDLPKKYADMVIKMLQPRSEDRPTAQELLNQL